MADAGQYLLETAGEDLSKSAKDLVSSANFNGSNLTPFTLTAKRLASRNVAGLDHGPTTKQLEASPRRSDIFPDSPPSTCNGTVAAHLSSQPRADAASSRSAGNEEDQR